MRKLLIVALLLVVPATSVRIVCTDATPDVSTAAASSAPLADDVDSEHCREMCARLKPKASGIICTLSTEVIEAFELTLLAPPVPKASLKVNPCAVPCSQNDPERCLTHARVPQDRPPKS